MRWVNWAIALTATTLVVCACGGRLQGEATVREGDTNRTLGIGGSSSVDSGIGGASGSSETRTGGGAQVAPSQGGASNSTAVCINADISPTCSPRAGACMLFVPDACTDSGFTCAAGEAAFLDECGCGCKRAPFRENPNGQTYSTDWIEWCNGFGGQLALFEATPQTIVVAAEEIYAWVVAPGAREATVWRIDKRSRSVRAYSSESNEEILWAPEVVVGTSDGDGPISASIDGVTYSTSSTGELTLTHAAVTTVVERRGHWDDDDYRSFIAVDADAVYWLAGPLLDGTSDGDPLALFRTCR